MKEMKITPPEGYEVDEEKSTFTSIKFKKTISKNIREKIQGMEDVFRLTNTDPRGFYDKWTRDYFDAQEIAEAEEKLIVAAYNQGIKVNWKDSKKKYYPYFYMNEFRLYYCYCNSGFSFVPTPLCFVGKEAKINCEDAVSKFFDVYKRSRTL